MKGGTEAEAEGSGGGGRGGKGGGEEATPMQRRGGLKGICTIDYNFVVMCRFISDQSTIFHYNN